MREVLSGAAPSGVHEEPFQPRLIVVGDLVGPQCQGGEMTEEGAHDLFLGIPEG